MIQQDYKNNVQDTSGEVTSTGFSIEINESMFAMLTSNIYNDPTLAVIREWSTNACDACLEAGNEVKFDVHLPTVEESYFSVRDYGTGLSGEDIVGLFSTLGASTKRNSNKYNGTFGIGRMAGLAVANAFTVESYHNGTKYSYAISMKNGVPVTMHLGNIPTTEPNGLCLSVNVDNADIYNYKTKAEYLYKYFDYKPNLNLDDVNLYFKTTESISDDWFVKESVDKYDRTNYVVMSQVPYQIPNNYVVDNQGFSNMVIKAPPGAVSFNPGRESLSLDKKTVAYLNNRFNEILDEYLAAAKVAMADTSNDYELMTVYNSIVLGAPRTIANNINPEKHASALYKNLFGCFPYHGNNTKSFKRISINDSFRLSTGNSLSIRIKPVTYSTSKIIDEEYSLCWSSFFYANHVIVDLKTNFRKELNSKFPNKNLITWQRNGNADLEDTIMHAKRYLDGMGIPYQMASDLVDGTTKKSTAAPREGLFVSEVALKKVYKATKMIEEDIQKETYLYLKLKHSTPQLSETAKHSFEDYMIAYKMLVSAGVVMPCIKGVAKKYQAFVENLDNWVDFEQYIEDKMSKQEFKILNKDTMAPKLSHTLVNRGNIHLYPEDIRDYYNNVIDFKDFCKNPNYINDSYRINLVESFNANIVEYNNENLNTKKLENKYTKSWPYITGDYYIYGTKSSLIQHLVILEDFYAVHST